MFDRRRRRTDLEGQLAEGGFPAGVGVPSAVLVGLLVLLAGFCVLHLREPEVSAPRAVVESQQALVDSLARSLAATAAQNVADLRTAVTVSDPGRAPADLLADVNQSQPKWRGMAVLERSTRKQVVTRGEPIPVPASITDSAVVPVARPDGTLWMLVTVPMPGDSQRVVMAATAAGIPAVPLDADLRQGLVLANQEDKIVDSRGTVPKVEDTAAQSLLGSAAAAASTGQTGAYVGEPGLEPGGPDSARERAVVVAYAPVGTGELGLSLLSVARAPVAEAGPAQQGIRPALALVVVALLGFGLIRATLVGPVRRLRSDALQVASGDLKHPVRLPHSAETRRIAAAVEYCRTKLRGEPEPVVRRFPRMSARLAVVLATLGLLAWSGWVAVTVGGGTARVPDSVVSGHRSQVGNAAETIHRTVRDGLADLQSVAGLSGSQDPSSLVPVVRELAGQERFRSVYLVDKSGVVTGESAGRPPLRGVNVLPPDPGVRLQDTAGRVPVLFAHAALSGGDYTLVGEFDVDHLADLLRRAPGRVRLVNSELRTLAATDGFVAFEQLPGEDARRGVTDALAGRPAARVDGEGRNRTVIVARSVDDLPWAVVSEKPVRELSLPGNEVRNGAMLVALIGALLAALLFGWHYLVLIRPLRRLAAAAKFEDVIYPQRQDEIGTIACCLEICRQALSEGVGRLGAVRRPRGAATDQTVRLPRIPADDPLADPEPRRRSRAEV
ncbi:HAMP domain-containing protein [Kibdelosporangium persicum]|uniref:HAMP domain-containing protein n=1 Tax=Kibdelosporangium persicum TaxID=2698649 RepID=A0ABX2F760_9PSEU|nr:HAMP domain-containing protein [Kibdelosporangium persicum]NRN67193.1 HAMP domain-containing protein [Kibdelosporangium persicum]